MPKARLSSTFCLTAQCGPGQKKVVYWDDRVSGFVLECRASGSGTYAMRYVDQDGVQRQHKIGRVEDITFEQARKTAIRLRSEIVLGGNPAGEKQERKTVPTYAEIAEQHLEYARTHLRRPENTEVNLRLHILPKWGGEKISNIKSPQIATWLAEIAEGLQPATVEKIRVTFGRSFALAQQWQIPGAEVNPVRSVAKKRFDNSRTRYLSRSEATRLLNAASRSANPQLTAIVSLLLLTGARKSELLHAKWEHIDLERRSWLIPLSKTGKARHVPLSQAAIDVLNELPRFRDCPFIVPNPDTLKPYSSIKRAWETARKEAVLGDLRLHDLRHSAASFMINAGIDLFTVGRVLGHADHQSTMRYSHLANDTLLKAVEAGAAGLKGASL